ncbi:hypothetical protein G3O08_14465 [Cryomorpha ignava]|uniref:PorT family protein n=1 Tax=Cryomorpha ignava TaxID=101383 RepID=A0A7K3WSP1_9FLAO|nr:hypothetical protein [Cryomorpha ignava]NEN24707.1 hypothetical protein [Cryomorpha ignava]
MNANNRILQKGLMTIVGILSSFSLIAQKLDVFENLQDYRKFSLMVGTSLYHSADSRITSGTMAPENLMNWGVSGGFEYDFRPERRLSFVLGLTLTKEPTSRFRLDIKKEEIPGVTSDYSSTIREAFSPSFSVPFYITYKFPLNKNQFLEFQTGGKVKWLPPGGSVYIVSISEDITDAVEVFTLKTETADKFYYGSYLFGAGITTLFSGFLIKTNFLYTLNFQDTYGGQYEFKNLSVSGSSTGTYALSGNNLSLMVSIAFRKPDSRRNDYY